MTIGRREFLKTSALSGLAAVTHPKLPSGSFYTETNNVDSLPVRGFCIEVPHPKNVAAFVQFIKNELVLREVNTLIILMRYHYQFQSHPELQGSNAVSKSDVKKIVNVCKQCGIRVIPGIDLLGHQSEGNHLLKLLQVYPQFDETPWVKMPKHYKWPNSQNLYCKSYCPLVPGLHKIIFDLIDEICDVFESNAFHAGMDEVFYIGMRKCPRCGGKDPAELFADEVSRIYNHLKLKERELWIWGDRLLDGKASGLGMWQASMNNTYRAIDMIPKDVVICDWHYQRATQTAVYFAMKGLKVVSCSWRQPQTAIWQMEDTVKFRHRCTPKMKKRLQGVMDTCWSDVSNFLKKYYGKSKPGEKTAANTLKTIFPKN